MAEISTSEETLLKLLKEVVDEVLDERREWIREMLQEVVEDLAFADAIAAGRKSELVSRDDVFEALLGRS